MIHIYREDNADHELYVGFIKSFRFPTEYNRFLDTKDGVLRGTGGNHIVSTIGKTCYSIPKSLKSGNVVILVADRDNCSNKKVEGFIESLKNADFNQKVTEAQIKNFYVIGCDSEPEEMKKSESEFKGKQWEDIGKLLAEDWFDEKVLWRKYCSCSIPVLEEICKLLSQRE